MSQVESQDLEHLRLLSIFHYVVGGLAALAACIPLIHFFLGLAIASGWGADSDPEGRWVGTFLMVIASVVILLGWAFAVLVILAGRYLARRTHYTYCLVMGAVACLFMPMGTVLGVFTIIVLMRPSVKALFDGGSGPLPAVATGAES